jgi:hypothetical protein
MADKRFMTVDEARLWEGLKKLQTQRFESEAGKVWKRDQHLRRLQIQHEKTVQLMKDVGEMQDVIDKYDSRVHWLIWSSAGDEGEATIACCGAIVHDGKHWYSSATSEDDLAEVTCPDCSALPEYNMKLLAQTDIGEDTEPKKFSVSMIAAAYDGIVKKLYGSEDE